MKNVFVLVYLLFAFQFSIAQKVEIIREITQMEANLKEHTGFMLYNPKTQSTVIEYMADRYYTPASNTKIFTMLTALNILGDSIPGLYYKEQGDSLIFWGTGDPSFLYENVTGTDTVYQFLAQSNKKLFFSSSNFKEDHFGPGWSWADYKEYYQVERTPFPIYGNYFKVSKKLNDEKLQIKNTVFREYFYPSDSTGQLLKVTPPIIRDYGTELGDYFINEKKKQYEKKVPFRYSPVLFARLLSDTLKKEVGIIDFPRRDHNTIYSVHIDSLFRVLMQESDNFIAEQLLLTASGKLNDTLNTKKVIDYSTTNYLKAYPDPVLWYDGSGLSRYNQFTPRDIVRAWEDLYKIMGAERLFPLLATGGRPGTLQKWYAADKPYVFGKTGTLTNHHSLSGFIVTDKGNTLIFSFMNSHYPGSSNDTKVVMQRILEMIKAKY